MWFGNVGIMGWFPDQNSGGTVTGAGTPNTLAMFTAASVIGDSKITQGASGESIAFTPAAVAVGASTSFTFTAPNNTNQTLSTEAPGLVYANHSRQWAAGALTAQREFWIKSPTFAFTGASTLTDAYTFYAEMPTAGANATFTRAWAAGFAGPVVLVDEVTGSYNPDLQIRSAFNQRVVLENTGTSAFWFLQTQAFGGGAGLDNFSIGTSSNNGLAFTAWSTSGVQTHKGNIQTSGAITNYTWTTPANTGQTAGSNIPSFLYTTTSRQWATGAVATQQEFRITAPTYSFVAASTITDAYTFFVSAPVAGANATITNNYAAGFSGNVLITSSTINPVLRLTGVSATIATFSSDATGAYYGSQTNNSIRFIIQNGTTTPLIIGQNATSGAVTAFSFAPNSNTGQTLSTEIPGFNYASYTRTWATGAIATQREHYIRTVTYAFAGASTITYAYGFYVEAPTAGANATITTNIGIGTNGNIHSSGSFFWLGTATPSTSTNYAMSASGSSITVNAVGTVNTAINGSVRAFYESYRYAWSGSSYSGGGIGDLYSFTPGAGTSMAASTEVVSYAFNASSKSYLAGAIATQRKAWIKQDTIAFASASTITTAYGLYVENHAAGSNATITNNYSAGFAGGNGIQIQTGSIVNQGIVIRDLVGSATQSAIYMGTVPSATNYVLRVDGTGGNTFLNGNQIFLGINGTSQFVMNGNNVVFQSFNTVATGAVSAFTFSPTSNSGQTASTEINGYSYSSYSRTWATGAIATQREQYIRTVTYAFNTASTITNAYGWYVEAPTAGGNATITNNYAAGFSGSVRMVTGRILENQGADVASANDLTLGLDGNSFEITGNTQINAITTATWQNGCKITLLFTSNPTVKHNTAGGAGTAVMLLAGAADFAATAGDTLTLLLSEIGGTQAWREIGRAVI